MWLQCEWHDCFGGPVSTYSAPQVSSDHLLHDLQWPLFWSLWLSSLEWLHTAAVSNNVMLAAIDFGIMGYRKSGGLTDQDYINKSGHTSVECTMAWNMSYDATDRNLSCTYDNIEYDNVHHTFEITVQKMNMFGLPVIIFGGLIGNTLSFIVFAGTPMRMLSCSVYLAFLNIADSIFLLTLLTTWLGWFEIYLFHQPGWCQVIIYLSYVSSFLSVWGVVCFTVERFIVVYFPLKKSTLCSTRRALIVLACLSLGAAVMYSLNLFVHHVIKDEMFGQICVTIDEYDSMARAMTAVDTVATLILPSICIIAFNIAIMVRVWGIMGRNVKEPEKGGRSGSRVPMSLVRRESRSAKHKSIQWRTTRSLLIVSTVFVILNLPSHGLRIHLVMHYLIRTDNKVIAYWHKWLQVLQFLSYANYSANFLLYCACNAAFRIGVRRMLVHSAQLIDRVLSCIIHGWNLG